MGETFGISNVYARKLIERSSTHVRRLLAVRFPRNERFLYLDEQYQQEEFWRALVTALDESRSAYGFAINSLLARDGIVPSTHFGIISGSPFRLARRLSYEVVLQRLLDLGLLEMIDDANCGACIIFGRRTPFDAGDEKLLRARMAAERVLLGAVRQWMRALGLGSYDKVELRAEGTQPQPRFGQFNWDVTAPCYLHPFVSLRDHSGPKPGFFVADVVVGSNLNEKQVRYFINKATVMRQQPRTRPFMGMLIADYFAPDAFAAGKTNGLVFTTPDILFGQGVSASLRQLVQTLRNAAAVAVKNPEVIGDLFSKLGAIHGASLNLQGPLFEMILGYCLRRGGSVDIGVSVRDPRTGEPAEVDVLVKGEGVVRACECKGYVATVVDPDEVRDWLKIKIPRIRRYLLSQDYFKRQRMKFEFWTTGQFSSDALDLLNRKKRETTKYDLDWRDGSGVRQYVTTLGESYISKILDEQYFRHPVASVARANRELPPVTENALVSPGAAPVH